MRVLAWDLENSPLSVWAWGLFDQNISLSQIQSVTEVICFGARWLDKKQVIVKSGHRDGRQEMLQTIWDLLDEADAVVSWNGKNFDSKHIMREFIQAGMTPPSPYKEIDLMQVVKSRFRAPSNKLDYWADLLLGTRKAETGGFQLWKDCMAGDDKAWKRMYRYQKQDVNLLVDLYEKLQPWIKQAPNRALMDGIELGCPACASTDVQRRGFEHTTASTFQKFVCKKCGKWSRARVRETPTPSLVSI